MESLSVLVYYDLIWALLTCYVFVLPLVSSKRAFINLLFPHQSILDRKYFLASKILVGNNF